MPTTQTEITSTASSASAGSASALTTKSVRLLRFSDGRMRQEASCSCRTRTHLRSLGGQDGFRLQTTSKSEGWKIPDKISDVLHQVTVFRLLSF
mmetsp:Transcript_61813/g.164318  ORF Transcript_61813/g.164318 Transcript_61813/m.164318 type:complete len:94 (+) Transcript_61813:147-428(+)